MIHIHKEVSFQCRYLPVSAIAAISFAMTDIEDSRHVILGIFFSAWHICEEISLQNSQDAMYIVHTSDMLWCNNLIKTHSQTSLNTSCIVNLFYPIELWSIAMPCGGQNTNAF